MTDTATIACPHCGATNRAAPERLAAGHKPNCGKCHLPLFDGHPVELADAAAFDRLVAHTSVPVLVDFWAAWCGPCRAMAPQFAAAAAALEPQVRLVKLDTDAAPDIAARYRIQSIPTLVLISQGREIARRSGAMSREEIAAFARGG